ncbi:MULTISPECIES: hypothetical protein [unclassified Amycolatopsis]|uniref:hypothetical protein n=1 Tax=unclassified Amycolatopsis TaxID=2618356 RepID=UPI00287455E6|nr:MULTISPECIES: hypothetical protein [unclassified Amycolatopsis]MDS0133228.1 hypothetical protein [Amycolatopsis sp. 505]MDS0146458.1 hypothetical protein [Amycolatopsis sp. CM201R]
MSDEQAAGPSPAPPEGAPAAGADKVAADPGTAAPTTRDQALNRLRGTTPDLSSVRFGKIIAEGLDQLAGVNTVNVFQGDFTVEGDFTAGSGRRSGSRRASRERLRPEDLSAAIEYFVTPPGFDAGVEMLAERNLLILSGPTKTGRRTCAIAMLDEVLREHAPGAPVFRLHGPVVGNLNWRVPQPGAGFLVSDTPGAGSKPAAEKVTDDWLSKTAQQLADQGSWLIVVTGPVRGTLETAPKRAEFVLEDMELPDPMEIVERHVTGEVPWAGARLAGLAAAGLADLLHDRDDPAFAKRAAAAIVEALRAGADLAGVLTKLDDPEGQVHEWLSHEPEPAEVALVLATAVLEGSSYLNVADAATKLFRELSGSTATAVPRYLQHLISERSWIDLVRSDDAPLSLKFKYPRLRAFILSVIWFELDGARTKVLAWLQELAGHTDVEVRARAAQAAGILTSNDFEHGVHRYLLPWAHGKSAMLRQSAAQSLNTAGTLANHADAAWSYIEQWAELAGHQTQGTSNLSATAGLAAGGALGERSPHRALRVLHSLVVDKDWGLLEPVAVSTQTLLEAGCGKEVLDALLEWTQPAEDEETVLKGLMMFAFAVMPEDSVSEAPLLLRTAARHREVIPELWGRALANSSARVLAGNALREWIRFADQDSRTAPVVLDVIAGIADRGPTDFDRLLHALRGWALDPDDPSRQAMTFHDQLVEAEEAI